MSTNVLITGATGLVGRKFAKRAVAAGFNVAAMVRAGSDRSVLDGIPVHFVEADLEFPDTLPEALSEADVVVHSAAHVGDWGPLEKYHAVNILALDEMLKAAERIGRLRRWVQISSLGVYPYGHHYGTDETTAPEIAHIDGYTQSKADAESVVWRHVREHRLPAVILRPGFVYGPGDRNVLPRIVEKIRSGKMKLIGRGERLLNNTSVENLCDAILLAIETPNIEGEAFNIRDERLVTREEFINTIADYLDKPHPGHVPELLARALVRPIEFFARLTGRQTAPLVTRARMKFLTQNLDYSIDKAKRILGYHPRVDFQEGIAEALDSITVKGSVTTDRRHQAHVNTPSTCPPSATADLRPEGQHLKTVA
jgi:nucleoside-diphosphate-sugar epimerase